MRNYFQRLEQCRYATHPFIAPDRARHGFEGWQATELADPKIFYNEPQIRRMLQGAKSLMGKPGDLNSYLQNQLDPNGGKPTSARSNASAVIGRRWSRSISILAPTVDSWPAIDRASSAWHRARICRVNSLRSAAHCNRHPVIASEIAHLPFKAKSAEGLR
jgi:hypothetical protein